MKTAILFNGPPSCGKDTLGRVLARNLQLPVLQFKDSLYNLTASHYDVPVEKVIEWNEGGSTSKTMKRTELNGIAICEALVHVSEHLIKPEHGSNFFGKKAASVIKSLPTAKGYVFTDSGFYEELNEVAKVVDRVVIFRVVRKSCAFKNSEREDSRQYLEDITRIPDNTVIFDLDNNNTIEEAMWTIIECLCLEVNVVDYE